MTTSNTYRFTDGFELSFEYSSSNNEEAYGDDFYGAIGYAGYEMRVVDCGRKLIIANADGIVATYTTVATIEYVKARLVYKDNTLTAYYDGEKVLTVDNVTINPGSYAISYTNGEKWRTTYLDDVYLGTF